MPSGRLQAPVGSGAVNSVNMVVLAASVHPDVFSPDEEDSILVDVQLISLRNTLGSQIFLHFMQGALLDITGPGLVSYRTS